MMRSVTRNASHTTEPLRMKYFEAHKSRTNRDSEAYTGDQLQQADYYLRATMYKSVLAQVSLEQLWALSYDRRDRMITGVFENCLRQLGADDEEMLGIAFGLEQYLLLSRTVVDFFKLYICQLLRAPHTGMMSSKSFTRALRQVSTEDPRAMSVLDYFGPGENQWLATLVSLRDKVAHRDRIRPAFTSSETLPTGELFDWPSIQGVTIDRFCQSMDNGLFEMFRDLFPVLFERDWIAGPYRPGLFGG